MNIFKNPRGRLVPAMGLAAVALIAGLGFSAVSSDAATLSCDTGKRGPGATFSLSQAADVTCVAGKNDTNTIDAGYSLFGKTGWVLSGKTDGADGDGVVSFASAPVNGATSGNWAVKSFAGLKDVVITLKAGNGFAAFLLDTSTPSGAWSSSKDLSHASIYYNGTPAPVPLPAAGWLLLGGLGGLGALARRRKLAA
jgi:hypothetical protein